MTFVRDTPLGEPEPIPRMPAWVTSARAETPEDVAFLSGGRRFICMLCWVDEVSPTSCFALRAAAICMACPGRPEKAG